MSKKHGQVSHDPRNITKTYSSPDGETLPSTSDTALDSSFDPSKMSPLEMAEWWLGQSLSDDNGDA
jgi:hypothetical protein|tara:strand:+ start:1406 stop:1603 length:198 start_codon:yes stop_codon:yes gene_type:complete